MTRKLSALTIGILIQVICYAQTLPFSKTYNINGNNIKLTANKNKKKFNLAVDQNKPILSENNPNVLNFYYKNVKSYLNKTYGNNSSQLPTIESIALNFSKLVNEIVNPPDNAPIDKLNIDTYEVTEFKTRDQEFLYALIDTKLNPDNPINILTRTGNVYSYNTSGIHSSNFLLENLPSIVKFINQNKTIHPPKVSLIKIGPQDKLYFENSNGTTDTLDITPLQASLMKDALSSNKSTSSSNEETAESKKKVDSDALSITIDSFSHSCNGADIIIKLNFSTTRFEFINAQKSTENSQTYYVSGLFDEANFSSWLVNKFKISQDCANYLAYRVNEAYDTCGCKNLAMHDKELKNESASLLSSSEKNKGDTETVAKISNVKDNSDSTTTSKTSDDRQAIVQSIVDSIEGNVDAGQFIQRAKSIPIYQSNAKVPNAHLDISDITLKTDYNRINDLVIHGTLYLNRDTQELVIPNPNFSLSFFGLNNRQFTTSLPGEYSDLGINYSDAVLYIPRNGHYSFNVQNEEYSLKWKDTARVNKRSLNDYLSLRLFLNPIGILDSTANGLLQLEGNVIIPMNTHNWKHINWLPQSSATFGYVYASANNTTARIIVPDTTSANGKYSNYINNLDIFRKYAFHFDFRQSIIAYEFKKLNTWIHAEVGFDAFGVKSTQFTDTPSHYIYKTIVKLYPVFSIRAENRPDARFGLSASLSFYLFSRKQLPKGNNDYNDLNNPTFTYYSDFMFKHELDYYALVGRKNTGGLFFKYIGFVASYYGNPTVNIYNGYEKNKIWGYYPQVFIGYSTNLKTVIKGQNK